MAPVKPHPYPGFLTGRSPRGSPSAAAARLAELERAANEPISAGSAQDDAKETVLVALHDRMAPMVVRIDAKVLLKAKREALAARQ